MDKLLGNIDMNTLTKYYSENKEMIDMLNKNMTPYDLENQINEIKKLNLSNFAPQELNQNNPNSKAANNKMMTQMINNSLLEMLDPEQEHKKLLDEYKRKPKTKFETIMNHQSCIRDIRNNKDYVSTAFKDNKDSNRINISRTSNLSMKMTKSNCNIHGMQKVLIRDMEIEKTHTNKYAILKIVDLPVKITAYQMLLEDENGDITIFALYNYDKIKHISNYEELDLEFKKGKYILIYEPYYKVFKSTFPGIRVDNPEEIQIFDNLIEFKNFCNISHNQTSEQIKNLGNEFMIKKEYHKALSCYEKALEKDPSNGVLYSNLAEVNLRLNNNLGSLKNSIKALEILGENHPLFEKIIFRKSKALYNLNRFSECKEELIKIKLNTDEKLKVVEEMNKICEFKIQNQIGIYDFKKMLSDEMENFYIDIADYTSNKIEKYFSKEKGIFIKANTLIAKGELICCNKSIACQRYNEDSTEYDIFNPVTEKNRDTRKMNIESAQEKNRKFLIEKIIGREEEYEEFFCLYDGDNASLTYQDRKKVVKNFSKFLEKDTNYIVKKINNILKLNSFGSGRGIVHPKKIATGLWVFPSFFNHSCVSNTLIYGIGDFLILRAGKDIEINEEITVSYSTFESSYEKRQFDLHNWKFNCSCALCSYQLKNTIDNPIKKYAFHVMEIIKEDLLTIDNSEKSLTEDSKEILETITNDKELMSHSRKFSIAVSENERKEIIFKLKNHPKDFYHYLNENKKLFSKIEMSLILFIYASKISKFVDDNFTIEILTRSYELIQDKILWFEIKVLLCILNIYMGKQDTDNYDRIFKILYDKYLFITDYDFNMFLKIFN